MAHDTMRRRWSPRARAAATFGIILAALGLAAAGAGCKRAEDAKTVTLYSSVDEPFAREVVAAFERHSGIRVQLVTDTEAGKTTGLVRRIESERSRPQADVFWSSELFNTIKLARAGMLAEYRPPAEGIPDRYRDPQGRWTAFGVRGRVIGYNTGKLKMEEVPATWRAMADPRWEGRLGVADPRFGTTTGHFAAMHALWGEDEFVQFLKDLRTTTEGKLLDGNATAAREVGSGKLWLCSTDTDDVYARQNRGEPVAMTYPDMGDGGTLLIPNSVGIIAGAPHPETAKALVDFLTSAETERLLAQSDSRNFPVRETLQEELNLATPPETKVEFDQIADSLDRAIQLAGKHLIR